MDGRRCRDRSEAKPDHVLGSRLGGIPYWPEGAEYPRDPEGQPLTFAAQIDFSEVPPLEGYPTQGIFQFYVTNDFGHGIVGEDPLAQRGYRAVFFSEPDPARARPREWFDFVPKPHDDEAPGATEHSLSYERDEEWMSVHDHRFTKMLEDAGIDPSDFEDDDRVRQSGGNKIGGYLNCYSGDDRRGYDAYCDLGYELFLQLDTEYPRSIHWGRSQTCKIHITPEDLAKADFSRVLVDIS